MPANRRKRSRVRRNSSREHLQKIAHAISKMRTDGVSLTRASREFGVDPRTVIRLAGSALVKADNGRYVAKDRDTISRLLLIPTSNGLREVTLNDSRQATKLAKYWDAVQKYLEIGDSTILRKFAGKHLSAAKRERIAFLTDLRELDRLGSAGVLSFESVYARSA